MKYENKEEAFALCDKITKIKNQMNDLKADPIVVIQRSESGARLHTIGTHGSCEHPFAEHAQAFLQKLYSDLGKDLEEAINKLDSL